MIERGRAETRTASIHARRRSENRTAPSHDVIQRYLNL
jgi:hypothetical protein